MKTISAIVSAYYAKDFIRERLDNLFRMNPTPEIIVVAQSGSYEAEIATTYDCTWILTSDIPTIYSAWNMAIKASNCDYITNANCDDHTYLDSYAIMSNFLENNPDIGVVYGNDYVKTIVDDEPRYELHERGETDLNILKTKCLVGPMPMWRKSLHDQLGYFSDKFQVCGDYEFWLRLAVNGVKFHHLDRPIGIYNKRVESAEHRQPEIALLEKRYLQNAYNNVSIV
ncbi:MAG: glycosyltransferase [Patescibacteria group bacterium]